MFSTAFVLLKIILICFVFGIKSNDYVDKDEMDKKLVTLEGNINQALYKFEINMEEKMKQSLNGLESSMKKELQNEIRKIKANLPCKEEVLDGYDGATIYSMDDENLNHVTLKRNNTGHLTYFETHIAIKANVQVRIRLTEKYHLQSEDVYFDIEVNGDTTQHNTRLDIGNNGGWIVKRRVHTPDILTSNQFRKFFVKIDHGYLEFGKEGSSAPIISYYDDRFSSLNYFRFGSWNAKIHYDCPAPAIF